MRYIKSDLKHLTIHQRAKLDCHYLNKTRTYHTGEVYDILEEANKKKHSQLQVPPSDLTVQHIKYFQGDYRSDQTWERLARYHYIGSVEFYSATTYCTQRDKAYLRTTANTSRPEIFYRYLTRQRKVVPVSKYCISDIAQRVREDNKDRAIWRRSLPEGQVYRDPFFAYSDQGESYTEIESESEVEEEEQREPVFQIESDTDSVFSDRELLSPNHSVISLDSSRAPSVVAVQQLLDNQEINRSLFNSGWDIAEAYTQGTL